MGLLGAAGPITGATWGILQKTGIADKLLSALGVHDDVWTIQVAPEDMIRGAGPLNGLLVSQTQPQDLSYTYEGRGSATDMAGDYDPQMTPTGRNVVGVSFRALFAADHAFEDLRPIKDALVALTDKAPTIGRKPICLWDYAGETFRCWVRSVRVSTDYGYFPVSGNPRAIGFEITLEKAAARSLDTTDPNERERETTWYTLRAGESPELLAWRRLGDPDLGVKVRQINRDLFPEPAVGDRVKVYDATHSAMRGAIRPLAVPFATREGLERIEALAQLRMSEVGYPPDVLG